MTSVPLVWLQPPPAPNTSVLPVASTSVSVSDAVSGVCVPVSPAMVTADAAASA